MLRASLLAIVAVAAGLPATAAVMTAVDHGRLQSGFDARLFFADDLADLTGKSASVALIYYTDRGTRTTPESDVVQGGPDTTVGGTLPMTFARVVIEGVELRFAANRSGAVGVLRSVGSEDWSRAAAAFDYVEGGLTYVGGLSAVLGAVELPVLLDEAFEATVTGTNRFGFLQIMRTGGPLDSGMIGSFAPESVVVEPYVAPIPLPATAGLLGLCLGAIGALRARGRAD